MAYFCWLGSKKYGDFVDILVIDGQAVAIDCWLRFAETEQLGIESLSTWAGVDRLPDAPVIVVDQSVVGHELAAAVSSLAKARPQSVIIATGENLQVGTAMQLVRGGAQFVFQKPLNLGQMRHDMADLRRILQIRNAEKKEFEELEKQFSNLTHREHAVLEYVLQGVSNKNAASNLQVSVRTIEARRAKVYQKTGSSHVVELVRKVDRFRQLSTLFARIDSDQNATNAAVPARQRTAGASSAPSSPVLRAM